MQRFRLSDEELKNISADLKLTDLIDVRTLQEVQDAFSNMARVASVTTDENGVPVTNPSNFSEFCYDFCRKSPIGRARCEQCDRMGAIMCLEQKKPVSYFCHAKLVDFAAPIMIGDKMLGSFVGGQILTEAPDLEKMRAYAQEIGIDEDEFVEASKKITFIPKEALDRSTEFLYKISNILSEMAYKEYITQLTGVHAMQAAVQKSDFLANMSHEIRTPMNAVLGMAELALRYEMPEEAKEYIRQIQNSGKHLLSIINDILDFSKIESGKMEIVDEKYNPAVLIRDVINIVNSRIGDKPVEFTVDVNYDMPQSLIGDSVRIKQMLINILNNAVKFTKQGNINLKVRFERISEEQVRFIAAISDTGVGIKEKDIGQLFQSFNQVDSRRNRNIEGTGLGLAITKRFLELMNGDIKVESVYEKGTTFTLQFPQVINKYNALEVDKSVRNVAIIFSNTYVRRQIARDLIAIGAQPKIISGPSEMPPNIDFVIIDKNLFRDSLAVTRSDLKFIVVERFDSRDDHNDSFENVSYLHKPVFAHSLYEAMGVAEDFSKESKNTDEDFSFMAPEAKVLIVDDNSINLLVAKELIQPLNMKVDTALNAQEAVNAVRNETYDIIFMDHMMPGVDGIEVTHIIRRMFPEYNNIPIIALTANAVDGARELFLKEGMNDFLAKPIELKAILGMIKKWLPKEKIVISDNVPTEVKSTETFTIEGLDIKSALSMLGSEKMLISILVEYLRTHKKKSELIQKYFDDEDWASYKIEVHSLKSTSKQIGANLLSDKAAALEKAANDLDVDTIKANNSDLLEEYAKVAAILEERFGKDEVEEPSDADPKVLADLLENLIEALDSFDSLLIDEVFEKISAYKFEGEEKEFLDAIEKAIDDCDLDLCTYKVRRWLDTIK